jgi:carboxypeptidase T
MWAYLDTGSSGDPCAEDYRGPEPFSEPETRAMRDFVADHPGLRIAINFHAWGNLLIHPFNYDPGQENGDLTKNHPGAASFYNDVWSNRGVPGGSVKGNGLHSIGYTADGEASDWMLQEHGIYALSPELGIENAGSRTFFI